MPPMNIIQRSQAKAAGLKRYFTGKPCQAGHVCERFVNKSACVECERTRVNQWKDNNRSHVRKVNAAWKAANPLKVKQDNADYYQRNKERCRENERVWRDANPKKRREINHRYGQNHPEKVSTKNRNRRARLRASEGSHTAKDVADIFKLQKGKCAHPWCRADLSRSYHVDHVIALACGGSNARANIQLLCPPCNSRKQAKNPVDVARENGMLL
jgi:5-methylcytosine-specific restriction endonuclease McrA